MRLAAACAAIALLCLGAPTWGQSVGTAAAASANRPLLKGYFVYVYSFMDVRESEFGSKILDQLDKQLLAELGADGVPAKILRFKQSAVGHDYVEEAPNAGPPPFEYHTQSSALVPVARTVAANAPDETATGAGFRLIEFPLSFSTQGAWRYYAVRWDLIDVASGNRVWSKVYNGSHLASFGSDGDVQNRASAMLKTMIGDFKKAGLL